MSKRYFSSDLHFSSVVMVEKKIRPFKSVERMNESLIRNINQRCKEDDILIHCGDVCQYGKDRIWTGEKINPREFINRINCTFVNIEGNHDANNKVKSVCKSMRTTLGKKYTSVSISHYPSTDKRALGTFRKGDVHIHGHVHNTLNPDGTVHKHPIFTVDVENKVLNVNVNCELWNYNPVSEDELICAIDKFMREEYAKYLNKNRIILTSKKAN